MLLVVCEYKSASTTLLSRHKITVHEENKFNCDECDDKFETTTHLKIHKETIHEEKTFNCDQCHYQSTKEEDCIRHKETTHDIPNVENTEENKAHSKGGKQNKKYVQKRKKCELCEKKFNKSETFDKHMRQVHGSKTNKMKSNALVSIN